MFKDTIYIHEYIYVSLNHDKKLLYKKHTRNSFSCVTLHTEIRLLYRHRWNIKTYL